MDIYHAFCDLKPGVSDIAFAENVASYMGHLKQQGLIESWRLTRRKLGLAPPNLGEFHLMIEAQNPDALCAITADIARHAECYREHGRLAVPIAAVIASGVKS